METIFNTITNAPHLPEFLAGVPAFDYSRPYGDHLKGDPKNKRKKHHFTPCPNCIFGVDKCPGLSVAKIPLSGKLVIPAVYDRNDSSRKEIAPAQIYKYEINETWFLIDGELVATAPKRHDTGKKFTPAQKLAFLKAIAWQLLNDEGSLRDQIDQLGMKKMPAPIHYDISIEELTGSIYPGPGAIPDTDHDELVKVLDELRDDESDRDIGDHHFFENQQLREYWPGIAAEFAEILEREKIANSKVCAKPRPAGQWYPQYRVYIQEVPA